MTDHRDSIGQMTNLLSKTQRDYLVDHVDGHRPVRVAETATRVVLMRLGLIRARDPRLKRPGSTVTTPLGREVLCNILGQIADEQMRQQNRINDLLLHIDDCDEQGEPSHDELS